MRYESDEWSATCGVHVGHHHDTNGQNCQDAVALRMWKSNDKVFICGVVCDGCGGAHEDLKKIGLSGHSEVGANLISDMIVRQLSHSTDKPIDIALENLFDSVTRYIDVNMWTHSGPEEMVTSIQQFWLTTINGFIMSEDEGYFFSCGDGCYQIDDSFQEINQQDKPHYIAYACCPVPDRFGVTSDIIPQSFTIVPFDPNKVARIMVATDGFTNHDAQKMDHWRKSNREELADQLHGQQWGKPGRFGLKKWMNTRYQRGYFNDDCAIVVAERRISSGVPEIIEGGKVQEPSFVPGPLSPATWKIR